jgi:hypothetical protein
VYPAAQRSVVIEAERERDCCWSSAPPLALCALREAILDTAMSASIPHPMKASA